MSATLHLGDCLDPAAGMASLPDRSIDAVITDPPYSEHVHSKSRQSLDRGAVDLGFAHIDQATMEAVADQFARLVRRWVLIFCDVESAHLWRGALVSTDALEYVRTCAWDKIDGAPQFTGDRPGTWGEVIVVAHPKGRKRWNGGGRRGIYQCGRATGAGLDSRIHTTQKPVRLMQDLIRDFTDEGETILDPFAGGGTTLFAAARLGRKSIGWEKDPVNHAAAIERLANVGREPGVPAGQGSLFTPTTERTA